MPVNLRLFARFSSGLLRNGFNHEQDATPFGIKAQKLGIVGLGYVGLPLAVAFGRLIDVVAFDLDATRVDELSIGRDRTREVSSSEEGDKPEIHFS